jgi:hypothetical protein
LHSIMPRPVISRSSLTKDAEISAMVFSKTPPESSVCSVKFNREYRN